MMGLNMKRAAALLLASVLLLPPGCGGAQTPPAAEPSSSSAEEMPSAAVCMGVVSHPVHRLVQLGVMEAADELGYEGHILGLEEGSMQELLDCWLQGAEDHDIGGAVCWVGDASAYEFLKELHGMGVKTVVPHFPHSYEETKDFIDANVYYDQSAAAEMVADYLGGKLRNAGIQSGGIGVTVNNLFVSHEDAETFQQYMSEQYPEFTVLDMSAEGYDDPAGRVAQYIRDNPELVAAFGAASTSPQAWAQAKDATGRGDIMVVGCGYLPDSLYLLRSGKLDALVATPLYEDGYAGMELIDEMLRGKIYNTSVSLWRHNLETPLIYIGGKGLQDPGTYADMHTRSKARFSINRDD